MFYLTPSFDSVFMLLPTCLLSSVFVPYYLWLPGSWTLACWLRFLPCPIETLFSAHRASESLLHFDSPSPYVTESIWETFQKMSVHIICIFPILFRWGKAERFTVQKVPWQGIKPPTTCYPTDCATRTPLTSTERELNPWPHATRQNVPHGLPLPVQKGN